MNESRANEEYWAKHKSSWENSGLSQRRYCQEEGLCPRKFNYHLKKLSKEAAKSDFKFIEVPSSILEKKPVKAGRSNLKVELPNGITVVLELSADLTLAQVIEVAGAARC
jgi:hypothetical protein